MKKIFLGVTGASGAMYAVRLLELLDRRSDVALFCSITNDGITNINIETESEYESVEDLQDMFPDTVFYDVKDFTAHVSSGSFMVDHYIIAPASMGCVGRIASGVSSNLIERCADVAMKERRDLILLFREAPLNTIHLENLLKLSKAGACIIPASPAFYHKPSNINELIDFMVGKIFDIIRLEHNLFKRWGSDL